MGPRWLLPAAALLLLSGLGCGGEDPTDSPSSPPDGSTPTATPSNGEGTPTPTPTGGATDTPGSTPTQPPINEEVAVLTLLMDQALLQPVVGATVCLNVEEGACTTSDGDGKVNLQGVPINSEVTVRISGLEKYNPWLLTATTAEENLSLGSQDTKAPGVLLSSTGLIDAVAAEAGVAIDEKLGIIKVKAVGLQGSSEGVKGLQTSLASGQGVGPIYINEEGSPDSAESATSSYGVAYWVNVPPGTKNLSFKTNLTCSQAGGAWDGSSAGIFDIPVEAGATTLTTVVCQ